MLFTTESAAGKSVSTVAAVVVTPASFPAATMLLDRHDVRPQGPPTPTGTQTGVLVKENAGLGAFLSFPLAVF